MITVDQYTKQLEEHINSIQGIFSKISEEKLNDYLVMMLTNFNNNLVMLGDIYAAQVNSGYHIIEIDVKFVRSATISRIVISPKRIIRMRKLEKLLS